MDWRGIIEAIVAATGKPFEIRSQERVAGGDINDAWMLQGKDVSYFVKLNQVSRLEMFEAEYEALGVIAAAGVIRVPHPVCVGMCASRAFIAMEYINLSKRGMSAKLGEQLAELHRTTQSRFGWFRDNTIGSTLQKNSESSDWIQFYRDQRLGYQLSLLRCHDRGGRIESLVQKLMECLPLFFAGYSPLPSLLHGDLWGGNYAYDQSGLPVLFDPALYFGDREADIAMTELFGGFGGDFYQAYRQVWPLDAGYETRKTLYNLYHILNHANLFGGGYLSQAETMAQRLLSELR